MSPNDKPLTWLTEHVLTPPLGEKARIETGYLLRRLQMGTELTMPFSRPMPRIGRRCHELRIDDSEKMQTWRLVYRIDADAIVILHWFSKKTQATAKSDIETCQRRMRDYDSVERVVRKENRNGCSKKETP